MKSSPHSVSAGFDSTYFLARRWLSLLAALFFLSAPCFFLFAGDEEVTPDQLKAVHALYLEAKKNNFDQASVIELYKAANAAAAVKKLVDAFDSNPSQAISPSDSAALEGRRQAMNLLMLKILAKITGGSVEVMDAGKQNGIRSDKDQMIFGVTDGKRHYTATEMKAKAEKVFRLAFGIPMEKMDMMMFDADAAIPDWRRADISFEEHKMRFEQGQAKLEQNPGAVREAGTWRKGAELRYATQSRVTLVKHVDPDRNLPSPEVPGMRVDKHARHGETEVFHVIENAPTPEASERYKNWSADVSYRNAMDAAHEWRTRFDHSADFIDRMKYFNRTVGDGINALALENWDVEYIFHLNTLKTPAERLEFIRKMVNDVYVVDVSADGREHFTRIIAMAAEIELDKMNKRTKSEAEYMKPLIGAVLKEAEAKGEKLTDAEATKRAVEKFHAYQSQIMNYNLMATARQKIRGDFTPKRLALIAAKYGEKQAKKLQWETARQIQRTFNQLDDDVLIRRIISDAPAEVQATLKAMHEVAVANRAQKKKEALLKLAKSDSEEAKKSGPQEQDALQKAESELARKKSATTQLLESIKKQYGDFDADLLAGKYSDEAMTERMRIRALDALGFDDRAVFNKMRVEYETNFRGSKLISNLADWGNAQSLISVIQVYQQTGDMTQVAQTALWELVSNVPGVSQAATLKQSFNDGDVQSLSWLFIAWKIPAAGQAKMVFDVAKGSVEILYTHAMTPLKDDRFSQVYMGYVEKQSAGWSPFVPGWKERRDAVSHSILHFVPGETFDEKRTNLYAFFNAQLDKKLKASGFDPTKDEYWKQRELVLPAFFRKYVHDYFNVQGDWTENVTAGLFWVGDQEELKTRLAERLQKDFEQGELNHRLAEVAKMEMMEALEKVDVAVKENARLEKYVAAAEDFLAEQMGATFARALDKAEPLKGDLKRVKVEVYPPAVVEGKEAVFAVKVASGKEKETDKTKYAVEIRPVRSEAVIAGKRGVTEADLTKASSNAAMLKPVLSGADADKREVFVTKLEYEVVVKQPNGEIFAKETVSLDLAGAETPKADIAGDAMLKMRVEKSRTPVENVLGRGIGGSVVEYGFEEPNAENAHPYANSRAYVWVRWKDMPAQRSVLARGAVSGGIPYYAKEFAWTISGYDGFEYRDNRKSGNAFAFEVPIERGHGGQIVVEGKLQLFPQGTPDHKMRETKPEFEFPFKVALNVFDPQRKAAGKLRIHDRSDASGDITVEGCQKGARLAVVKVGGYTFHERLNCESRGDGRLSFRLPYCDDSVKTATVTFRDFGKEVTLTADLEVTPPKQRKTADERNVKSTLDYIAKMQRENEDAQLHDIASAYRRLATDYSYGEYRGKDYENWKTYYFKHVEFLQRGARAMRDPNWKGYDFTTRWVFEGKHIASLRGTPQAAAGGAYQSALHHTALARSCGEAATYALRAGDLKTTRQFLKLAQQTIEPASADKNEHRAALSNVAGILSKLAEETLRQTGDLAAAKSLWNQSQEYHSRMAQLEGRQHVEQPYPLRLDEEFSQPAQK